MSFLLPELGFEYADLEPHIDARTMEIHHSKHHNGYTNNLNNALENVALTEQPIEEILRNLDMNNAALRNNAGGYYNHCLFWEILNPKDKKDLDGDLESAINSSFGSFENFKEGFSKAAATRFGSGWAWLCVKDGKLEICSSANQDNPIMPSIGCGGKPIMGIDVWEHAYYLNYQNRRADYITAFFDVVNWRVVSEKFKNA
ncbi:MAG: superoxide dismutase [Pelagibacteraceae bacterium]|jgi:superoxide dismutase, Fe-Mn family|nr:superoxide dismutase [Flavobacteriaceae bacterium]MBT6197484.1 superoxide dismutase [Pelagibacteraceae bacterium]MBT4113418.1 superoxide dismutase [Flavobacteriaceae bacterium]MBT4613518.1 superoxide dismutase [Flavobacteriaceae bacterium]MBT5246236.1 superoxide dismutase [Flavobacteriaceae bacterium]|tara:strand:- start:173 stop:775 length:603 start_codon:yes stop_codon:yes gene_type:complete